MSVRYRLVQWTRAKLVYDAVALACIAGWVATFEAVSERTWTGTEALSGTVIGIRAWGSCAFALLTVVLCIGPLARLDRRFAPLLYNRRHLGVMTFFVAAFHANEVLGYYHAYSDVSQLESLLTWDTAFTSASWPFQLFGAAALLVFAVMAATSHDFWQKTLGPTLWKWLHMSVYAAWALVVAHVAFGALQVDHHAGLAALVVASVAVVGGLHLLAARRERRTAARELDGWLDAGPAATLEDGVPRAVEVDGGERLLVVRHGDGVSAMHGVCAHQGGPLAEGRVIDGCLTCPWHGWQYRPGDGCSPPPFQERLPTHRVRLADGHVWVERAPRPAGTALAPALLDGPAPASRARPLFVGYLPLPAGLGGFLVGVVVVLALSVGLGASTAAALQSSPGMSQRDKGETVSGVFRAKPYGHVHTWDEGEPGVVLLAAKGKFGVAELAERDGEVVELKGLALERDGVRLLEVQKRPGEAVLPEAAAELVALAAESLGEHTLTGEIVDSKCYTGRMRPGAGRGHRACAQLCIRGGVPPVLVTEAGAYVLSGPGGEPVHLEVLPWVAEPVEVRGEVVQTGALRELRVALPEGITRLPKAR